MSRRQQLLGKAELDKDLAGYGVKGAMSSLCACRVKIKFLLEDVRKASNDAQDLAVALADKEAKYVAAAKKVARIKKAIKKAKNEA